MQDIGLTSSEEPKGSGPLSLLCLVAGFHRIAADPDSLAHQLAISASQPVDVDLLQLAARKPEEGLGTVSGPNLPQRMPVAEFARLWLGSDTADGSDCNAAGEVLLIASRASLIGDWARFDFSWFIRAWQSCRSGQTPTGYETGFPGQATLIKRH